MKALISLEDVHKRYDTGRTEVHALRGIDLRIDAGEWVVIMGPSGSGKTTLLEILGCLSQPTSGAYHFSGVSVESAGSNELAALRGECIGFVFQAFNLLPRLTLIENVELPLLYRRVSRNERRERAREVLERVGLDHRAHHLPSAASGGERQRAAIARALVNRPSVLLADEPTGNLDTARGQEILAILQSIHESGATVVTVTHDPLIGGQSPRTVSILDGAIESDERSGS